MHYLNHSQTLFVEIQNEHPSYSLFVLLDSRQANSSSPFILNLTPTVIVSTSVSDDNMEALFERTTFFLKLDFSESARLFSPSISGTTIRRLAALRSFYSVITISAPHGPIRAVNAFSVSTLKFPPSSSRSINGRAHSNRFSRYSSSSFIPHLARFSFITLPTNNNNNNNFSFLYV